MSRKLIERTPESPQAKLERINVALSHESTTRARQLINEDLTAPDIAHVLSSMPPKQRAVLWNLLDDHKLTADVLSYMGEEERAEIVARLEPNELVSLIKSFDFDDKVDLLQELPENLIKEVL